MNRWQSAFLFSSLLFSSSVFANAFNLNYEHVPGELIVKFKNSRQGANSAALAAMGGVIKYQFKSRGAAVVKFRGVTRDADLLAKAKVLNARADVEYVEANTIIKINKTPNDADFSKQYGMHNTGDGGGVAGADIDALSAWDISTGSKNVVVGVIDTGIDHSHPDIAPNYWTNPGESGVDAQGRDKRSNGVDDDSNGYIDDFRGWDFVNNDNDPMDDHAHGTHCAGVIGARGDDGVGVAGVNWDVSLVGIKFLSGSGSGTLEDAVKAIEYGTSVGVSLTSNSWGGGGYSPTMFDAITAAHSRGILFVAAAGNDSNNNDSRPSYPATYQVPNVISVAASDNKDQMAYFSNNGVRTVHVAAPGVDVWSSVLGGRYQKMSGTSMATPHVAGLAALIKGAIPEATHEQVRARILNGVDRSPYWATKVSSGGRINALNSLETDNIPPAAIGDLRVVDAGTMSVSLAWTAVGDDDTAGDASAYEVRLSSQPIVSDDDWNRATRANASFSRTGDVITSLISFDDFAQQGYVAVRAVDNVGNSSRGGASVEFATRAVNRFFDRNGSSMDGFRGDVPWGVEELSGGSAVLSDSPGGLYRDDINVALTSDAITVPSNDISLSLDFKYDVESSFDFFNIEVSQDGGATWRAVDRLTGVSGGFVRKLYALPGMNAGDRVSLRFRLESDSSISRDGVQIRNVSLVAPL